MNRGHIITTLALILIGASVAWAQGDQTQPPAPPPVPAFGQDSPAPAVTENPPISAIDQPGLEPHAAPESFLLPGLHLSESVDSNAQNQLGQSSVSPVERALGSLTLQKLWRNYDVAVDYIGGVDYSSQSGVGLEQVEQFDIDNRINWKRGQLAIRDSLSYLPEGTFGFGAYGGSGAYNSSLGTLSTSLLGGAAFGGQSNAFYGGNGVSVGEAPRLLNLGLADVVEDLTPKSSVTLSAGYGLVHFYDLTAVAGTDQDITFIGSHEETAQVAYDRILNPKDQVALSYGYQAFDFSTVDTAFHSSVIQAMYGHRISGRLDFLISAGPQFTHIDENPVVCSVLNVTVTDCTADAGTLVVIPQKANHIGAAGRVSLRYRFPKTSVEASYQRYNTSGSGVFAGSRTDVAQVSVARPLSRVWDVFGDLGYSKNTELQVGGSTVNATSFTYGFAGVGVHRQFGRNLRGYVSYQFNEVGFNTPCPVSAGSSTTGPCSNTAQRQVGTIGVDWSPRPIRLN
jgi:hypothetical protein